MRATLPLLLIILLPAVSAIMPLGAQARYDLAAFTCFTTTTAHPLAEGVPFPGGFSVNGDSCDLLAPAGEVGVEVRDDFSEIEVSLRVLDIEGEPCSESTSTQHGRAVVWTTESCRIIEVVFGADAFSGFVNAFGR